MKVKEIIETTEDYNQILTIEIDGKRVLKVWDGEPEDNNLHYNFSGCFSITKLMELAYNAGKNGEKYEYGMVEMEWSK